MESGSDSAIERRAFVLMPFDSEFNAVYDGLIKTALEEVGYVVTRADSVIDQQNVLRDIVTGIDRAQLIVADLTGLNPNVFYELVIAHGLGVPTVLITQSAEELPFDLRTYRVSEYSTRFDEAEQLQASLREVGQEAATGAVTFGSPVSDFLPDSAPAERLAVASRPQAKVATRPSSGAETAVETAEEEEEEEEGEGEPGLLDLIHTMSESGDASTKLMAEIGGETEAVGNKVAAHTARLEEAASAPGPGTVAAVHRIATDVARDLQAYADALAERLPALEQSNRRMIDSGIGWITRIDVTGEEQEVASYRQVLTELYDIAGGTIRQMTEYRQTLQGSRGATSQLDRAVDRVTAQLDRLLTVMEDVRSFATRASEIAKERLGEA
jgi:DNA-binding ferritin-like protein